MDRLRIYKYSLVFSVVVSLINVVELFVGPISRSDDRVKMALGTILIVALGCVLLFGRRNFQVGSNMRRSLLTAGFGFIAMSVSKVSNLGTAFFKIRIFMACATSLLFAIAFFEACKTGKGEGDLGSQKSKEGRGK